MKKVLLVTAVSLSLAGCATIKEEAPKAVFGLGLSAVMLGMAGVL